MLPAGLPSPRQIIESCEGVGACALASRGRPKPGPRVSAAGTSEQTATSHDRRHAEIAEADGRKTRVGSGWGPGRLPSNPLLPAEGLPAAWIGERELSEAQVAGRERKV